MLMFSWSTYHDWRYSDFSHKTLTASIFLRLWKCCYECVPVASPKYICVRECVCFHFHFRFFSYGNLFFFLLRSFQWSTTIVGVSALLFVLVLLQEVFVMNFFGCVSVCVREYIEICCKERNSVFSTEIKLFSSKAQEIQELTQFYNIHIKRGERLKRQKINFHLHKVCRDFKVKLRQFIRVKWHIFH